MKSKKRKVLSDAGSSGFERWEEWGPLSPALDVRITNEPGWFHFLACVRNPRTGETWVDVYGGKGGKERFRAFATDRIRMRRNGQPFTRKHREHVKGDTDNSDHDVADGPEQHDPGDGKVKWLVATQAEGVVFKSATRKAAADFARASAATKVRRDVIRPGLVMLTPHGDQVTPYYVGSVEQMAAEGFTP